MCISKRARGLAAKAAALKKSSHNPRRGGIEVELGQIKNGGKCSTGPLGLLSWKRGSYALRTRETGHVSVGAATPRFISPKSGRCNMFFFSFPRSHSLDTSDLLRYCEKGRRIRFEDALGNENICPWRAGETTSVAFLARTEKNARF